MLHLENWAKTGGARARALPKPEAPATLTPNQQMIYGKLLSLGRAAGAYELLDLLRDRGVNAAPTVYRALHELESKGLVRHLVATRQFIALEHPCATGQGDVMLVCEHCQDVIPLGGNGIIAVLDQTAAAAGFEVRSYHLELIATCADCRCGKKEAVSS